MNTTCIFVCFKESNMKVVEMGSSDVEKIMKKAAPEIFASKSALLTSEDRIYPFFINKYPDYFLCETLWKLPLTTTESTRSSNFVKQNSPFRDAFNIKYHSRTFIFTIRLTSSVITYKYILME